MTTTQQYRYFNPEDRVYRVPEDDYDAMELWNPYERIWEPYHGDHARVLVSGTGTDSEPPLPVR